MKSNRKNGFRLISSAVWALVLLVFLCSAATAQVSPRIVNGTEAPQGKYPWAVSLQADPGSGLRHFCTGTLVAPRWVLTAAHCAVGIPATSVIAVIGAEDLRNVRTSQQFSVVRAVIHPEYHSEQNENDIALYELAEDAGSSVGSLIPPDRSTLRSGQAVQVIGWGDTSSNSGRGSPTLQEASISIYDQEVCSAFWGQFGQFIPGSMLCATTNNSDTCQGDSGGPVLLDADGEFYHAGITSFGIGCASGYPAVYTRTSAFQNWVAAEIGQGDSISPRIEPLGDFAASKTGTFVASVRVVDNLAISEVTLKLDGAVTKPIMGAPFSVSIDTSLLAEGWHQLSVDATDFAGNTATKIFSFPVKNAPEIVSHPASVDAVVGGSVSFQIVVKGLPPFRYQWQQNGVNMGYATSPTLSLSGIPSTLDGAQISVTVSNERGTVSSNPALVTLVTLPTIQENPQSVTVPLGNPVSFSVAASGKALRYQWQEDNTDIVGATNPTLTFGAVTEPQNGKRYRCIVKNAAGIVTSDSATLGLRLPAKIITQPRNMAPFEDQMVTFSVSAAGTDLTYQWKKNGMDIPGEQSAAISFPARLSDNGARLSVTVRSMLNSVTSNDAVLTVQELARITAPPQDQVVAAAKPVTFSIVATGASLKYQWYRNGAAIAGATGANYTFQSATSLNNSMYTVVVTGPTNSVASQPARLIVPTLPVINTHPVQKTVALGEVASFSVSASGAPLTYQWKRNGIAIMGANEPTYSLLADLNDNGALFSVTVTSPLKSVTSNAAKLTVLTPASITKQPQDTVATAGKPVTFSVEAAGSSLSYQWYRNGVLLSGATAANYTFTPTLSHNAMTFSVVVKSPVSRVTSDSVVLSVYKAAAISTQPVKKTVVEGQTAKFTVAAVGSDLSYQWYRDGEAIEGATASSYELISSAEDSGASFSVVVKSPVNSVSSTEAALTVLVPAEIVRQPEDQIVAPGAAVTFSVEAKGSLLTYQWYRNGIALTGKTAPTLIFTSTLAQNGMKYWVVVKGPVNSVSSRSALLTVR